MNVAPVVGFERDVGSRTTIRVVGHRNFKLLQKRKILKEVIESNTTRTDMIIISWMSSNKEVPKLTSDVYQFAFLLANLYPEVPIYSAQPDRMVQAEELFKKETGFTVKQAHTMLTTGWYTIVHAMEFCSNITVYGMANEDFCSSTNSSVAYHYYESIKKKSECEYYNKSENRKRGGHLFITEKSVFRRWSSYMDITFKHPMWPRKESNGTLRSPFLDKHRGKLRKTMASKVVNNNISNISTKPIQKLSKEQVENKPDNNVASDKINSLNKRNLTHNNMSVNSAKISNVLNTSAKLETRNLKPSKKKRKRRRKYKKKNI
ncbi:alpha-N-acetyl-neuraminyl-2,3-beta-galactosyl-1,3-N-acetyl-galactosaminide alpha-2,6-sialyltransferase-like [Anneissia japonica]|uniref:alpha-N-acetyl-neuraminyl-2,3-beta-galactosyl-1, 3-N-acetyl-galactosaminide alpha-2,6-sialyltransferase-like n=1 Tax=Anneissia japonica TaxID=1529436 RepID=UPI001425A294|nr:alpha-N-acetyl-neuraminyl-2,3-beta-galactosyl-1,3-N-acetyl-galactosaminide alpha-2,6-sialyltransferase-like [Anneissia japonica]